MIKKKGKNIKSIEIGTWIRKNSKHSDNAVMVWDSMGRLIGYKEFNKNTSVSFNCKYWYETINGKYYRLENMTIFDDSGNPIIKGHRYWITKKKTNLDFINHRKNENLENGSILIVKEN